MDIIRHPQHLRDALAAGMVWTLLLVLATYAMQKTLSTRYSSWTGRLAGRFAGASAWIDRVFGFVHGEHWLPVVGLIGMNAAVLSLVDPRFGFEVTSARLLASMTSASVVAIIVPCWLTIWLARVRWGVAVRLRGAPVGMLLGALGVIVSRSIGFVPGLLTGQVYSFSQEDNTDYGRMPVLRLRAGLTLGSGGVCWIVASIVPGQGGGFELFIHDLAVAGMALALTSTLIELIPLTFLAGGVLFRCARMSWVVLMATTATAFALIVVPLPRYWLYVGNDVMRWIVIAGVSMLAIAAVVAVQHHRQVMAAREDNA